MKSLLIIATLAVVVHQTTAEFHCPKHENTVIMVANPVDCGTYYECVGDQPFLMHCAPGLQWADSVKRCDWPNVANCHPTDNTDLPSTLHPTTPFVSTSSPEPTTCPEHDGPVDVFLPNSQDCGSYYKCINGIPILIECPHGQQWSQTLKRCDWPNVAKCNYTDATTNFQSTAVPTSTSYPTVCPAHDGPVDVLLPDPYDCTSFYKCFQGAPVLNKCPPGEEWADELKRCDWPDVAHCTAIPTTSSGKLTTVTTAPTSSTVRPTHCPAHDGPVDVLLPNPKDCHSFFKCYHGQPVLIKCPAGQEWADQLQRCDWPDVAHCHVSADVFALYRDEECPAIDGPDQNIFFPNPNNCSTYYVCEHGDKTMMACPIGLKWHQAVHHCDWPQNSDCEED